MYSEIFQSSCGEVGAGGYNKVFQSSCSRVGAGVHNGIFQSSCGRERRMYKAITQMGSYKEMCCVIGREAPHLPPLLIIYLLIIHLFHKLTPIIATWVMKNYAPVLQNAWLQPEFFTSPSLCTFGPERTIMSAANMVINATSRPASPVQIETSTSFVNALKTSRMIPFQAACRRIEGQRLPVISLRCALTQPSEVMVIRKIQAVTTCGRPLTDGLSSISGQCQSDQINPLRSTG